MLKIPNYLRLRDYGGCTYNHTVRKANFQHNAPGFLANIGDKLGIVGAIVKTPGSVKDSGTVALEAADRRLSLHEDPQSKSGLLLEFDQPAAEIHLCCNIAELEADVDLEDWVWRVKKMTSEVALPAESSGISGQPSDAQTVP